jgi:hypothetical protein
LIIAEGDSTLALSKAEPKREESCAGAAETFLL